MAEFEKKKALLTVGQLKALTPEERDARWGDVAIFIKSMTKGWKPREDGPPKSIDDLKLLTEDQLRAYWPDVLKVIESAAGSDNTGPAPKTLADVAKMSADQVAAHIDAVRAIVAEASK